MTDSGILRFSPATDWRISRFFLKPEQRDLLVFPRRMDEFRDLFWDRLLNFVTFSWNQGTNFAISIDWLENFPNFFWNTMTIFSFIFIRSIDKFCDISRRRLLLSLRQNNKICGIFPATEWRNLRFLSVIDYQISRFFPDRDWQTSRFSLAIDLQNFCFFLQWLKYFAIFASTLRNLKIFSCDRLSNFV